MRVLHPDGIHRDLVLRADTASDLELIVRDTMPKRQSNGTCGGSASWREYEPQADHVRLASRPAPAYDQLEAHLHAMKRNRRMCHSTSS